MSTHPGLDLAATDAIPLAWVRSHDALRFANLGDALSPLIVAALSGRGIRPMSFRETGTRLASIGTIGQELRGGEVHLWGTGFDSGMNEGRGESSRYRLPEATRFVAHAVRGPHSRETLVRCGVEVPEIYGDPAWFVPRLHPARVAKDYEVGVVLHISELTAQLPDAGPLPGFARYRIDGTDLPIRIISTFHEPTVGGLLSKLDELLSCRRIVSTSFHGLVLADAYRIPSAYFSLDAGPAASVDPRAEREQLDHRVADFYAGSRHARVPVFRQPRAERTDWGAVIRFIDSQWTPVEDDFEALLEAFPFARVASPTLDGLPPIPL